MTPSEAWKAELEHPSEGFFEAFARRISEPEGLRDAVREAVRVLIPRVDWAGHLPGMPHGLLGLWAVLRLRPFLEARPFRRLLALQLLALARTGRARSGSGLGTVGRGSGHWPHVELALRTHRPDLAWGEVQGLEAVDPQQFADLMPLAGPDMANVGHKAVALHRARDLFERLERPRVGGRHLLGWAAWVAATEPADTYWHQRMARRLAGWAAPLPPGGTQSLDAHLALAKVVDVEGLVATLDAVAGALKAGWGRGDLLPVLVQAAAWKLLDARPDLEGKTGWTLVYLSTLAAWPGAEDAALWGQAAALVNLYPSEAPEDRLQPRPRDPGPDPCLSLREAVLDGEPETALDLAGPALAAGGLEGVLRALAESVAANDPGLDQSGQVLALAAAADLLPALAEPVQAQLVAALAKSLANSQTSGDLGRQADRALKAARNA